MRDAVHISFAKVEAPCPYCGHLFSDRDDKIVKACNKNKDGITRKYCANCCHRAGLTYNMMSELVAFKLIKDKP